MTNNNYTRTKRHNHEKLRAAMRWHGIGIKELANIIGKSYESTRKRLNGQVSFGMIEVIKIYDALGLNTIENYFANKTEKGIYTAIAGDLSIIYQPADAWEIPNGAQVLAYKGEDLITGLMLHATYPPVIKSGEEYLEIKPGEQEQRVIVLGQVLAVA
jgi:hypothetical protein